MISIDMRAPRRGYPTGAPAANDVRSLHVHDRPHLDRAVFRPGHAGAEVVGLVQVFRLDDVVPAELLVRLGEGAVRRERFSVLDPDRRGARGRGERIAGAVVAALLDRVAVGHVLTVDLAPLLFAHPGPLGLLAVD